MASLYSVVGQVLLEIYDNSIGIRSALYKRPIGENIIRKVAALVHQIIRYDRLLAEVLGVEVKNGGKNLKFIDRSQWGNPNNKYILVPMVYDFLFKKKIIGGGSLRRLILDRGPELNTKFNALQGKYTLTEEKDETDFYRFIRVTERFNNFDAVKETLETDLEVPVHVDDSIPNLLYIVDSSVSNKLVKHPLNVSGNIVLQDKGSCLTAHCAGVTQGARVLDICAAPGSKSLHILDRLNGEGVLCCVEKSHARGLTLVQRLIEVGGLTAIPDLNTLDEEEFLELNNANTFKKHINYNHGIVSLQSHDRKIFVYVFLHDIFNLLLTGANKIPTNLLDIFMASTIVSLDPSCSGTGLRSHGAEAKEEDKIKSLSTFQSSALSLVLTKLPNVQTVCYSTCSIIEMENEGVVHGVLQNLSPAGLFEVVDANPENWMKPERAVKDDEMLQKISDLAVRTIPAFHHCRGFFLCKLQKREENTEVPELINPQHLETFLAKVQSEQKEEEYLDEQEQQIVKQRLEKKVTLVKNERSRQREEKYGKAEKREGGKGQNGGKREREESVAGKRQEREHEGPGKRGREQRQEKKVRANEEQRGSKRVKTDERKEEEKGEKKIVKLEKKGAKKGGEEGRKEQVKKVGKNGEKPSASAKRNKRRKKEKKKIRNGVTLTKAPRGVPSLYSPN